jgi:hypothetical protein
MTVMSKDAFRDIVDGDVTETTNSWVFLDKKGILRSVFRPGAQDTLETAQKNVAAGLAVSKGIRRPLLLDMTMVSRMSRDARTYYASNDKRQGAELAVALLINSPVSRVIGNFFLWVNRTMVPVRLFTSQRQAIALLESFLS